MSLFPRKSLKIPEEIGAGLAKGSHAAAAINSLTNAPGTVFLEDPMIWEKRSIGHEKERLVGDIEAMSKGQEAEAEGLRRVMDRYDNVDINVLSVRGTMVFAAKFAAACLSRVKKITPHASVNLYGLEVKGGVEVVFDQERNERVAREIDRKLTMAHAPAVLAQYVAGKLGVPGLDGLSSISGRSFLESLQERVGGRREDLLDFTEALSRVRTGILEDIMRIASPEGNERGIFDETTISGLSRMASQGNGKEMIESFLEAEKRDPEDRRIDVCLGGLVLAESYDLARRRILSFVDSPEERVVDSVEEEPEEEECPAP